jgi:predicted nucleotidyltransferase
MSYAQTMTEVYRELYPQLLLTGEQPNHVLGLTYAQENAQYTNPMTSIPLPRIGASYHSKEIHNEIASATAIRKAIIEGLSVEQVVPQQTTSDLQAYQITWNNYWEFLKYRIIISSVDELREIYQMVEGLEYRLKSLIYEANSFEEFVQAVKTKRYTQTRIQRLLCYVLLNIKTSDIKEAWESNYLHVLGFTENGQRYLKEKKAVIDYPVLSKIGKKEEQAYKLTVRSDKVYQMANSDVLEQNFGKFPIRNNPM